MSQKLIPAGSACLILLALAHAHASDEATVNINETEAETAELSAPPLEQIEYPDSRPDWVEASPQLQQLPHTWIVIAGPNDTPQQSAEELRLLERASIETYLQGLPETTGRIEDIPLSDRWIDDHLVMRRYDGEVTQEGLTLYEHAVEMQIDEASLGRIRNELRNVDVRDRLGALGVLFCTGLAALVGSSVVVGSLSRRADRKDRASAAT